MRLESSFGNCDVESDVSNKDMLVLHYLQIEGKTLHQQKDYSSLYCGSLELNLQYLREAMQ